MKILEQDGHKYSREQFDDYKIRVKVRFEVKDEEYPTNMDIYTTDTDKESIISVLNSTKRDKVVSLEIIHTATKEEDDIATLFMEETLSGLFKFPVALINIVPVGYSSLACSNKSIFIYLF